MMQFGVYAVEATLDGVGGTVESEVLTHIDFGYLDMITGTSQNYNQKSHEVQSTHILIVPNIPANYQSIYKVDSIVRAINERFRVIYVDNPVNVNHHLEIYLKREQDGV